jgi:DNA-3-methyladenine glycosylase
MSHRLDRAFYRRNVVQVARALLGQKLIHVCNGQELAGIIVETEAYLGVRDKAAHTFGGRRTQRNASMWADGGHAYVYFTYGMHHCVNVVAGEIDQPVAVLIRALQPVAGLEQMQQLRRQRRRPNAATGANRVPPMSPCDLCSGPAKLTVALGIDRSCDGIDLVEDTRLYIERMRLRAFAASRIAVTPRIGIGYAEQWTDKPLRFVLKTSPPISP